MAQVQVSSFSLQNALSASLITTRPCWFVMRLVVQIERAADVGSQLQIRRANSVHGSSQALASERRTPQIISAIRLISST